ncbi:hypothetical protein BVRB_9g211840 [Beta vulgaris subsp. vulgaris]|nr:hypothetical protein BVRB_9g211840 [Beta vulgaris subsp. vulgaris]
MKSASYGRLLFWSLMISLMVTTSTALDTVTPIQSLHDGKTLVSPDGNFELGFFGPGNSTRRYLGIWFKNISVMTYVWVANGESPLLDSFDALQMTNQSVLTLVNSTGGLVWSSNTSRSVSNPVAQLLDSGNLVVKDPKDDNLDNILWQSFDYPCYTLLSEMKLGKNFVTGLDRFLTSWKSSDDPSPGSYTYWIDPTGYPQPFLLKDNVVQFRDGPWNGLWFSSTTRLPSFTPNEVEFVLNNNEMYYVHDSGQDLYVKVPFSELGGDKKNRLWIPIRSSLSVVMLLCGATLYIWWRRRKSKAKYNASSKISINNNNEGESELPIYAFDVIAKATNNFSVYNKLGQAASSGFTHYLDILE